MEKEKKVDSLQIQINIRATKGVKVNGEEDMKCLPSLLVSDCWVFKAILDTII